MAGHLDQSILVRAPLELTWRISNDREEWAASQHQGFSVSTDGRIRFQVTTQPDSEGRRWTYTVERVVDPKRHLVYSRRWDNPAFRYSVAWWLYREVDGGTEIRCVQDFEMVDGGAGDDLDERMGRDIAGGTRAALERMAANVESRAGVRPGGTVG